MRFLQKSRDKNHSLHSKIRIDSKFYAIDIFSIIARDRDACEITLNENVASIFVTEILDENVELLLTLKTSIE